MYYNKQQLKARRFKKNVYNPYNIVMKHVENKGYNKK